MERIITSKPFTKQRGARHKLKSTGGKRELSCEIFDTVSLLTFSSMGFFKKGEQQTEKSILKTPLIYRNNLNNLTTFSDTV